MIGVPSTFLFIDIFPNYTEWERFSTSLGIEIDTVFDRFCYEIIRRHYGRANIRYSVIEAFTEALGNVYTNKYLQYSKQYELIKTIHQINNDELTHLNQNLTNFSENPNTNVSEPLKPLSFISSQLMSVSQNNKLQAFVNAINNIPTMYMYEFLKGKKSNFEMTFNDLFMVVLPNNKYYYERNDN